jgi:AcrR family transcriptional regulator
MSEKREARRQEILQAALTAFAEKGYDKTTMDDIVEASGLSKGTLYWHFKNKQALFAALVSMMTDQMIALFDEALKTAEGDDLSPPDALRTLFTGTAEMLETTPLFSAMTADFYLQAVHIADFAEVLVEYYAEYIDRIARIVVKGIQTGHFRPVDARNVAATIGGALDGISLLAILKQDLHAVAGFDVDVHKILDTAADTIITGLMKGKEDDR